MRALDLLGDRVDEEAGNERGDRRHQEYRARNHAEPGDQREQPLEDAHRRVGVGHMRFEQRAAALDEQHQPAVDADADRDEQHDRKPDRFEQDGAQRRRGHLGQRFDRRIEHIGLRNCHGPRMRAIQYSRPLEVRVQTPASGLLGRPDTVPRPGDDTL